ncbi:DNA polymerase III subunit delta [Chloroflexota bacterium]
MFYVFHGEDEFGRSEELSGLRAQLAEDDPVTSELNTNFLDGKKVTMGELRHASDTIPFIAKRRMVIVDGLLTRLGPARRKGDRSTENAKEPAWKAAYLRDLVAYLPDVPETTRLFFVEDEALQPTHRVLKLVKKLGKEKGAVAKRFDPPKEGSLPGWIQTRAQAKGGDVGFEARQLLSRLVGSDLRMLDQEIDKLLLYADGRQVTAEDVRLLVSRSREASVFDLVDNIGQRQTDQALILLHEMLEDLAHPLYLLAMLARQVRILIQVSELRHRGLNHREAATQLGYHPFPTEKAYAQSKRFTMAQLETAHQQLVRADWLIKTGQVEDELALDMLVVALTRG